jgi:signal transduction histidine kinase
MEGTCRPRGITFDLTFEAESEMVNADRDRIEQVVYNLVDNAVKFSHNDSAIEISTSEKGNKVFVSVKDHGVGIAADKIKKIWERFYKTDSSRGRDRKGSGLGLSIVKEIIQAHGEEINVVSTENAGTEFIFTLARTSE